MTADDASKIYHTARMAEYAKHQANYCPVNQRATELAGFQAVIDAVTREIDNEWALKIMANNASK